MFDNDVAGSATGQTKSGLTSFGRKVVNRLVKNNSKFLKLFKWL